VGRDGRLTNVQLERSSGVFAIDQLAMKAVQNSSPVEPFPQTITIPRLTMHLTFTPRRFSSAYTDAKIQNLNAEGVNRLTGTGRPRVKRHQFLTLLRQ
jgi:TonB family protein